MALLGQLQQLIPARNQGEGHGTQTAGLIFAGAYLLIQVPLLLMTDQHDTATATMATARANLGGAGIQTAALGFGGTTSVPVSVTEEYNAGSPASPTGAAASTLTTS
jgi:hypothetical protein